MLLLDPQSDFFRSFIGRIRVFHLPIHLEAKSAAVPPLALRDRLRDGFLRRGWHGYGRARLSRRRCHLMISFGRARTVSAAPLLHHARSKERENQNDLGSRARAGSRRLGSGIKPSRCASFLAALRARRTASAFSRVLRSDGFSYALRRFISRKMPSRCIFFLRALRACSTLLSRTNTCKMFPILVLAVTTRR